VISVDTNILLYALNPECAEFGPARELLETLKRSTEVVLCEQVLVELYLLLRNPKVVGHPQTAAGAVAICQAFRSNPRWRIVEGGPVMAQVWSLAMAEDFPRRRIIDARIALTLQHHGVRRVYTRNRRDFLPFGFDHVIDPIA